MSLGEKSGKVSIPDMLIKLAQWPEVHNSVANTQVLRREILVYRMDWLIILF